MSVEGIDLMRHTRTAQAWAREARRRVARRPAGSLKEEYGAQCVLAFGSRLRLPAFHLRSHAGLALGGLDERRYLRAGAQLLDLDPAIAVNPVEAEHARPGLLDAIQRSSVER